MSDKIDKAMLKNPDVFVGTSNKVFDFIERHLKTAMAIALTVVVLGVGFVTYGYVNSQRERKAGEALYQPEAELKKAEAARQEKASPKGEGASKVAALHPEDFAKDYAPYVEKIKSGLREHSDTKAALVSALNLSYFLTQQKQFSQALEVLDMVKYQPGPNDLLGGFRLMHRGLTLLENKQVDPAISSYESVLGSEKLKSFHSEALLKLGLCFELKGDLPKARATYERVGREFPDTDASQNAQQFLRLLDLKSQSQG